MQTLYSYAMIQTGIGEDFWKTHKPLPIRLVYSIVYVALSELQVLTINLLLGTLLTYIDLDKDKDRTRS